MLFPYVLSVGVLRDFARVQVNNESIHSNSNTCIGKHVLFIGQFIDILTLELNCYKFLIEG